MKRPAFHRPEPPFLPPLGRAFLHLRRFLVVIKLGLLGVLVCAVTALSAFEARIINVTATIENRACDTNVNFDFDANGDPILPGQKIDDEYLPFGLSIYVKKNIGIDPDPDHPAIAFNSDAPSGGQFDLGTPNEDFGGSGIGDGGTAGAPGQNDHAQYNLLIVASSTVDVNGDDLVDNPASKGELGKLMFVFTRPTTVYSLRFIDIDEPDTKVRFYDSVGNEITVLDVPALGDNSAQTVNFTDEAGNPGVPNVGAVKVRFAGTGGVDDLCYDRTAECEEFESRSKGFWKTHSELWILPQTVGQEVVETPEEAAAILDVDHGSMRDRLEAQLLAMKFNMSYFGLYFALVPNEMTRVYELEKAADLLLSRGDPPASDSELEAMKDRVEFVNVAGHVSTCGRCPDGKAMILKQGYLINGTTEVDDLRHNVSEGDRLKATFEIPLFCEDVEVSFASYEAPNGDFDEENREGQEVFDYETGFFDTGTYMMEIDVPECFFQVDFAKGPVVFHFDDEHNYQDRLLDFDFGGEHFCTELYEYPDGGSGPTLFEASTLDTLSPFPAEPVPPPGAVPVMPDGEPDQENPDSNTPGAEGETTPPLEPTPTAEPTSEPLPEETTPSGEENTPSPEDDDSPPPVAP